MTTGHIQGIATDAERKYMYYSFTTSLIKTDMNGNVIGSVKGLAGHLGCIAYNYEDGRVYGSLEYKNDCIGTEILERINKNSEKKIEVAELENLNETGEVLALADIGLCNEKTCIHGIDFPYGSTGMISLGDGYFYFSRHFVVDNKWGTSIGLYKFDGKAAF